MIYITGKNGANFISTTISPNGMKGKDVLDDKIWKISLEDKIKLEFSASNHKTLEIKETNGYQILSMYGVRC